MSSEDESSIGNDLGMKFPVITISISYDDPHEPVHVDLGSVPPFVAASIFEQILEVMEDIVVPPKVTIGGHVLFSPVHIDGNIRFYLNSDDDEDND